MLMRAALNDVSRSMVMAAVPATSRRARILGLSLRPMVNSRTATPRSPRVSTNSRLGRLDAPRANPAARKPTSGGRRSSVAANPKMTMANR